MTSRRHSARAVELLKKVATCGLFDQETLARELVMSERQFQAYLSESADMPLERQLCLAQFVIERVPPLARLGHRLRGQVSAALAFNARVTTTHADAPPMLLR